MASPLATLLLLCVVCVGFGSAQFVMDCCLDTTDKPLPFQVVKSHVSQEPAKGCKIAATVIITRAGLKLCAPHRSQSAWVNRLIQILEKRNPNKSH